MNRKLLLIVLAVILMAALVGMATFSWFTDSASVADNIFTAGTLEISVTDPVDGAAFSIANMAPGDVATGSITVKNSGTLDMQFTAVVSGTSSGGRNNVDLADMLDVEIILASVSGSPRGDLVYSGTLADLIVDPYRMSQWTPYDPSWGTENPRPFSPGMTAQFDVKVTFNENAGNDYQGAGWEGEITFYGDQWNNPYPLPRRDMVLWLDATRGVVLDENNRVSQWLDQSGKGNHAVQEDPDRRPEYIPDYLNGKPSLYFYNDGAGGGTSRYLAGNLGVALGEDFTIFIVTKPINRNYIYTIYGAGDAVVTLRLLNSDWWIRYDEWMTNYLKYIKWINLPLREEQYRIITMRLDSGAMGAWMEGELWGTNEIEGSGIQGHCLYGLGADYNGSFMCTCHIAEFIVYNTGLKDHEREAVEKYLSEKYGIPLAD